jgi:N-acetylneuraminic acid mutarotase
MLCLSTFSILVPFKVKADPSIDISAQYSSFVSAFNNYKQIFGQDVSIGQTVDRTLAGVINDPPAHYQWHSWAGQTYPDPPDGFSIRIETIQPGYVYKIIALGYIGGSQPSASGWIQVNSPFKIEQINWLANYTFGDGSYVHAYINIETGRIDFSAKWYNWPALIDATAFRFTVTIAKSGGTLPPFSLDTTRALASYAYDTDTSRVIMFGGQTWLESNLRSDLWTFNPSTSEWSSITTGSQPSERIGASISYNTVAKNFLLFGGGTMSGEAGDTWKFQFTGTNTGTWTQIAVGGPSVRSGAPMVFDSKNNVFVLFGGERYVYSLDETWTFNPSTSTWANRNPSPSPSQRARSAMAYDAKSGKVLLFGGLNKGAGALLSDTWLYDAATNTWQQVSTATAPSARQWPSLASDGNGVFYLFGGWRVDAGGGLGQYLDDTWKFDMATMQWTQLSPPTSPIGQSQGAFMYIGGSRFILINGWRDSPLGEVWFYDMLQNTWSRMEAAPKVQVQLTVTSLYDSATPTSGPYTPGTSITASVTSPIAGPAGTQYVCTGWTGTGEVPVAGTGTLVTFTINQDSTLTWNWKTQYFLTVQTDPQGVASIGGQGWYDEDAAVTLTAPFVSGSYRFYGWDVDGTSQGMANPIIVHMSPHTATAHYSNSAVGGEWAPINTIQLLTPYIAFALIASACLVASSWRLIKKRW